MAHWVIPSFTCVDMLARLATSVVLAAAATAAIPCPRDAAEAVEGVNAVRRLGAHCGSRGAFGQAPAVQWQDTLHQVAMQQLQWLHSIDQLRHTGPDGQPVGPRALQAGYRYQRVGENLAHGQRDLGAALRDWTKSETHCAILFHPAYTDMALGCQPARDGRPLWVLVMGRPGGPAYSRRD